MKIQKLFLSFATAFLMVGASGAAMAVDCASGIIAYAQVEEIIIDGQTCFIHKVLVEKNVDVKGGSLTMIDSTVGGTVFVRNGNQAVILFNTIAGDFLKVKNKKFAVVVANIVNGNIVVSENDFARVNENAAAGNITCENNIEEDSVGNRAGGKDRC